MLKKIAQLKNKLGVDYNILYPLVFTIIFVLVLLQYSFFTLEATFYDLWTRFDISKSHQDQYVIVYQDETTDQFLGEVYPYSYATHLRIFKRIIADQPKAVIYFIDFKEVNLPEEQLHYQNFTNLLLDSKHSDIPLRLASSMDLLGELVPPEDLQKAGYSLGIINEDSEDFSKDGVSRKAIINISGEDTIQFWAANTLRKIEGKTELDSRSLQGAYYNVQADATFVYFRYPFNMMSSSDSLSKIPFHRVIGKNLPEGFFKNKIVLIGHQYVSRPDDFVLTPFHHDQSISKLSAHAAIIESLRTENTLYQVPKGVTDFLSILIVCILSLLISRINPSKGLLIIVGAALCILFISYSCFIWFGVWLKVAHMTMSIFLVYYIWVPFRAIAEYQTRFAIQEETKLIKKVDHLKQNFLSLMSHDLKTPVAKITGLVETILLKLPVDALDIRKYVHNIMDATTDLNSFITSILDLTKIESQNIKLNLQSKDLNSVVEQVVEKLKDAADSKNMALETELSPLYPIMLDTLLMNRVISNIIENAIKYAGVGKKISVRTWDDEQWVYLEITDNGYGIDDESLKHVFDKFYRVKNDASHAIKGTGLGLYLVKYFIELHQGKISVSSQLQVGTKFLVQLQNK